MDLLKLGNLFMDNVKESLKDKFPVTFNGDNSTYSFEVNGKQVQIVLTIFGAIVTDMSTKTVTYYEFIRGTGDIVTYLKLSGTDNDNLNVVHGRCIRDMQDTYAIKTESASLLGISYVTSIDEILHWPYPFFGDDLTQTLQLFAKKYSFTSTVTEPEYGLEIKPEEIVRTIETLSKASEAKLSADPSR